MDVEPIYCAEQIRVPPELAEVLKNYTKEVIRRQPEDLVDFSAYYFSNLANITPETPSFKPPTVDQISQLYRLLLMGGNVRTADVDTVYEQASVKNIPQETVDEVMRIGRFGHSSVIDPTELCLLLLTTCVSDTKSLLMGILGVYGESGSLEAGVCRELFEMLGKYDAAWRGDFLQQLDEQIGDVERVGYNSLVQLPCMQSAL